MNRKIIAIALALMLVFCSACGKTAGNQTAEPQQNTEGAPKAPVESEGPSGNNAAEPSAAPETAEPDPEKALTDRIQLFADFLPEYCVPLLDTDSDDPHFDLLLLDADDLPELAIIEDNYHPIGVHVFKVVDGQVKEVGEFGSSGTMLYREYQSIIDGFYMGMGSTTHDVVEVRADGSSEVVMTTEEYYDGPSDDYRYFINGEEVDADVYYEADAEWQSIESSVIYYEKGLRYMDYKEDLFDALMDRYYNPPAKEEYSYYGNPIDLDAVVGSWTLYRYETEGEDGYAGENGTVTTLTVYENGTLDYYYKNMYEDAVDLKGLEFVEKDGLMSFEYTDGYGQLITNSIVGMTADGELEMSVSFEYPDGTYGGSEWFYVRAD